MRCAPHKPCGRTSRRLRKKQRGEKKLSAILGIPGDAWLLQYCVCVPYCGVVLSFSIRQVLGILGRISTNLFATMDIESMGGNLQIQGRLANTFEQVVKLIMEGRLHQMAGMITNAGMLPKKKDKLKFDHITFPDGTQETDDNRQEMEDKGTVIRMKRGKLQVYFDYKIKLPWRVEVNFEDRAELVTGHCEVVEFTNMCGKVEVNQVNFYFARTWHCEQDTADQYLEFVREIVVPKVKKCLRSVSKEIQHLAENPELLLEPYKPQPFDGDIVDLDKQAEEDARESSEESGDDEEEEEMRRRLRAQQKK